jgi:putative transposase
MSANQATYPIATMARVLGVSEAGYHAWLKRPPSKKQEADTTLLKRVRTIHASSRETYGAPRVHAELRAGGEKHGRKRIARLMRVAGLVGASRRRSGITTTRRDREARPAPDLVDRKFAAPGPNRLWVADITFVPTASGFLYLAVVLDAWSRKIVGWAMANHIRAELVVDALEMAIGQRRPGDVIHHSDQGSQYTSLAFGNRCREAGVRPSMGSVGDAYDNATLCANDHETNRPGRFRLGVSRRMSRGHAEPRSCRGWRHRRRPQADCRAGTLGSEPGNFRSSAPADIHRTEKTAHPQRSRPGSRDRRNRRHTAPPRALFVGPVRVAPAA